MCAKNVSVALERVSTGTLLSVVDRLAVGAVRARPAGAERLALALVAVTPLVEVAVRVGAAADGHALHVGVALEAPGAGADRAVVLYLALSIGATPDANAGVRALLRYASLVVGTIPVPTTLVCHENQLS